MMSDRALMRVADVAMRRLQASHVGMQRSGQIEQMFLAAGLVDPRTDPIYGGIYAYVNARKPPRLSAR
jgi:hypothetical protein